MSVNPKASAAPEPDFFALAVARKQEVAQGIYLFELRHPEGAPLPAFTAGSHLTVQVPSGVRRNCAATRPIPAPVRSP